MQPLDASALDTLFLEARTHNAWLDRPITDETIRRLFDLVRMAPTSANSNPGRFVFVRSRDAKERLRPALAAGNVDKTMSAPLTVIVAYDTEFHEHMPKLFPSRDFKSTYAAMPAEARAQLAAMNGTLSGAYMILAARATGLDCGPMGGFDKAKVDEAFFAGSTWRSLFLINLGYGDPKGVFPRNPRLEFADAARIE